MGVGWAVIELSGNPSIVAVVFLKNFFVFFVEHISIQKFVNCMLVVNKQSRKFDDANYDAGTLRVSLLNTEYTGSLWK